MASTATVVDLKADVAADFRRLWMTLPVDVCLDLLCRFTLRELQILSGTDNFSQHAHTTLRKRLEDMFKWWELDVDDTLTFLGDTRSIISGSFALYLCNPGSWWPGDIDFYVPRGRKADAVSFFALRRYVVVIDGTSPRYNQAASQSDDEEYTSSLIHEVVTMCLPGSEPKINIVVSASTSAEAPVLLFHSTQVMNFITSTGVVCLYPELTLKGEGVVNHPLGRAAWLANYVKETAVLRKYRSRGYRIEEKCSILHAPSEGECRLCDGSWGSWRRDALAMSFKKGGVVKPLDRAITWKLGSDDFRIEMWGAIGRVFQRGAIVLIQGDGDGYAFLYHGVTKALSRICIDQLEDYLPEY